MTDQISSQHRLKKITSMTAITVATAITFLIPLGFFIIAAHYESRQLQFQIDRAADAVSQIIYKNPDNWMLQEPRLNDYLEQVQRQDPRYHLFVIAADNEVLVESGSEVASPKKVLSTHLTDGINTVGQVQGELSLRPLFFQLTLVLAGSFTLGLIVNIVLQVLPFAALRRAMDTLSLSQAELEEEVRAKDYALAELKKLGEAMQHQALHDELTDLPNRNYFQQQLADAVRVAQEEKQSVSTFLVDLDRFKEINDTLGHHMGDEVLIQTAKRIADVLPKHAFLARLGGDEYAIIMRQSSIEKSERLAEAITATLKSHIVVDEYHLVVPGSIGIAQCPEHGNSSSQLLRHADIAMYQAKRGGHAFVWYQQDLDENVPGRLVLTAELRSAIDNKQLSLHYQSKVNLKDGSLSGVEALVRWHHPQFGFISPVEFVTIAEQAGMINALTDLVIETALQQLYDWRQKGILIGVAINISAQNLQNVKFPSQVRELAQRYEVEPHWLTFEVTESSIMIDPIQAKAIINELGEWGAKIAVDDFGTGYSSLAYVKRLDINELKIDKSFVMNMFNDKDDQAIVRSTIDLAHSLGLSATAEGIEDEETYELLQQFGCDIAQGYFICRPVAPQELLDWINCWNIQRNLKS